MKDRDAALDTMAREELGLDPDQLGAPWSAAISRLLLFAMGVVVVLPFMFGCGLIALIAAIVSACVALFVVGAAIGLINGRNVLRCGIRQLLVGGGTAVAVFMIGHLAGAGRGA